MNHHYNYFHSYYHGPFCQCDRPYFIHHDEYVRFHQRAGIELKEYGKQPLIFDIEDTTEDNDAFRRSLWTGDHLQLTLMSLQINEDIGLEVHHAHDQFIKIEEGTALVQMGDKSDQLTTERHVDDDDAIIVPAGTWHNVTNIGNKPLKLYSIYAPPEHDYGTVQQTK